MPLSELVLPLILASILLSFERIAYVVIWQQPLKFINWARRYNIATDPVIALERLFYAFKILQITVFTVWIIAFADSIVPFSAGNIVSQTIALVLIVLGQILNLSTFWQLGRKGIFYGVRFGHDIPWCKGFPFSICPHPQYFGTVMSIWGLFLFFLYPGLEWILIPLIQTVFYSVGSYFENLNDVESIIQNGDSYELNEEVTEPV